jgi:hypothetical protein
LGIDSEAEPYLMHVAEAALLSPPPRGWSEERTADGRAYFARGETTTWVNPALERFRADVVRARGEHIDNLMLRQARHLRSHGATSVHREATPDRISEVVSPLPFSSPPPALPPPAPSTAKGAAEDGDAEGDVEVTGGGGGAAGETGSGDTGDRIERILSRRLAFAKGGGTDNNNNRSEYEYKVHWRGTLASEDEWFLRSSLTMEYGKLLQAFDESAEGRQTLEQQREWGNDGSSRSSSPEGSLHLGGGRVSERGSEVDWEDERDAPRARNNRNSTRPLGDGSSSSSSSSSSSNNNNNNNSILRKLQRQLLRQDIENERLHRQLAEVREDRDSLRRSLELLAQHSGVVRKQLGSERDESHALRRRNRLLRHDALEEHGRVALMLSGAEKTRQGGEPSRGSGSIAEGSKPRQQAASGKADSHNARPAVVSTIGSMAMSDAERAAALLSARSFYDDVFYSTLRRQNSGGSEIYDDSSTVVVQLDREDTSPA